MKLRNKMEKDSTFKCYVSGTQDIYCLAHVLLDVTDETLALAFGSHAILIKA